MDNYTEVYKSICRVCLSRSSYQDMVCLFDTSNADGLSNHGKSMANFANIKLNSKDNSPSRMCKNCLTLLNQAIMFKDKCENSDLQLKTLMTNNDSNDDYKKRICEYTTLKHSFPDECVPTASISNSKDSKPIKTSSNTNTNENLQKQIKSEFPTQITSNSQIKDDNSNSNSKPINTNCNINTNENIQKTIKSEFPTQITSNLQIKNDNSNSNSNQNSTNNLNTSDTSETKYHGPLDLTKALLHYYEKLASNTEMNKRQVIKSDFTCTICDKQLKCRQTYDQHMQRHNGCKYICDGCAKSFPTMYTLNVHQVAVHGIGSHLKCDHCPFKTATKLNLIEHKRLHTGERPYTCEKCGLTFRRKAIYKDHLKYHDEKTVKCLHCTKMFYSRSAMHIHMNNVHERLYVYVCNECGITYAKNITVRRHLTEKHGIPREMQGKIEKIRKGSVWPVK